MCWLTCNNNVPYSWLLFQWFTHSITFDDFPWFQYSNGNLEKRHFIHLLSSIKSSMVFLACFHILYYGIVAEQVFLHKISFATCYYQLNRCGSTDFIGLRVSCISFIITVVTWSHHINLLILTVYWFIHLQVNYCSFYIFSVLCITSSCILLLYWQVRGFVMRTSLQLVSQVELSKLQRISFWSELQWAKK